MRFLLPLGLLFLLSSCDSTAQPSEAVHYSEVDVRPEPSQGFEAFSAQITYPELARRAGIEGTVLVMFTVNESGNVIKEPAEYSNDRLLNAISEVPICYDDPGGQTCETSLRAILAAEFTPGYVGDEAVLTEECFAFEYWLPEGNDGPNVPTRIRASHCP